MAGKMINPIALASLLTLLIIPSLANAQKNAPTAEAAQLFVLSDRCLACHNDLITPSGEDVSIGSSWQSSMMAHSSRDPYWQAAVRRETLDHPSAVNQIQDECAACHMPMARYQAKRQGEQGKVFAHLPILPVRTPAGMLAADAVSCSLCHQIEDQKLGTQASFNAGFLIDHDTPMGKRRIFGPFEVDQGRTRLMQSAAEVIPTEAAHIQESELCASCHTLYTHALGPDGKAAGSLPEQVPYLEWLHSDYRSEKSCQSCHMPVLDRPMAISGPLSKNRQDFSRHVFRGGNFLMPRILNRHRTELGVTALSQDLVLAAHETTRHLQENAARLDIIKAERSGNSLAVDLSLINLAGHKLPTAYPSRRAWIQLSVRDHEGKIVFESGALRPDGSIAGNDNDLNPRQYEPHYDRISQPDQVQIYESIMADSQDEVTTGLISAVRFIKDNRMLPEGFNKKTAQEDIAVQGSAVDDADFQAAGDRVRYEIALQDANAPLSIQAQLWYQPIAFRWAQNLATYDSLETRRFVSYYEGMSDQSAVLLAQDEASVK